MGWSPVLVVFLMMPARRAATFTLSPKTDARASNSSFDDNDDADFPLSSSTCSSYLLDLVI